MQDPRLGGKVAIVTGAGRGIGRAIACSLAREGALIALAARTGSELSAVKTEIERMVEGAQDRSHRAIVVPTDLTVEADVKNLVRAVEQTFGRLDILVNNAGIAVKGLLAETTTEEWDRTMAVNARAPFLLCREAIPMLKNTGGGCIVNIVSVVGKKGYVAQGAYAASKHALMGMTKVLAMEVKADGIRVHAICPGGVATDMIAKTRPELDPDVLISPEEIADIVLFLVTRSGNAVIDEIDVRRAASDPLF